jgi:hypothetical protein
MAIRRRFVLFMSTLSLLACGSSVWAQPQWVQQLPLNSPSARFLHSMVYDEARQQVVLFGGTPGSGTVLSDTWVWDGSNWTQKSPANSPPARLGASMAYDAAHQQVVLFGGTGQSLFSDTWVWDGNNWTQKQPATSPPAVWEAEMAYDAAQKEVVLFSGLPGPGPFYVSDQTWVWDGNNWTLQSPPNVPLGRYGAAIAYDGASQQVVMFGGTYIVAPAPFGDTWAWDRSNWDRLYAGLPSARLSASMAYDAASQQVVLFGGLYYNLAQDTWAWGSDKWMQEIPSGSPPARYSHAMAYDEAHQVVVLFGGQGYGNRQFQDTWVYLASAPAQITLGVPTASTFGRPATLTASVSPSTASGVVSFYDGPTMLGTAPLIGGLAQLTTISLPAATSSVRAYYDGGGTYPPVSAIATATVNSTASSMWTPAAGSPVQVGSGPFALVVADFNGDTIADLAVSNSADASVTVLLGNGKGGFSPTGAPVHTGNGPFSLVVGDFNGDGKLDLAIANSGDNTVTILLGDGHGGFAESSGSPIQTGAGPISLTVADFNSDGYADLVVANAAGPFTILLGNGHGGFTPVANSLACSSPPNSVSAVDISLDLIPDLIFAEAGGVEWFSGNGDGTFSAPLVPAGAYSTGGTLPVAMAVADFNSNGNGAAAVAVANLLSGNVSILSDTGVGFLNSRAIYSTGTSPESVAFGDFNGDGALDLAIVNSDDNDVTLLFDIRGRAFVAPGSPLPAGPSPFSIVVADFNGDGRADLAIANFTTGTVTILLGK